MRWLRARGTRWAVWAGVLALGLNALVPVHLAFDLAAALAPTHRAAAIDDHTTRNLVALLALHPEHVDETGHHHHHGHHEADHHGAACPVCAALGSLAALTLAAPTTIAVPAATAAPLEMPRFAAIAALRFPAFYRSRAPPLVAST